MLVCRQCAFSDAGFTRAIPPIPGGEISAAGAPVLRLVYAIGIRAGILPRGDRRAIRTFAAEVWARDAVGSAGAEGNTHKRTACTRSVESVSQFLRSDFRGR